ncbi:MAG: RidA family protein, partial [Caulobacterales bacterium]
SNPIPMHSPINPPDAPEVIGPFSHGVVASGRLLFVSGQGPQDPLTKSFRLGDFEDETRLTLDNVTRVLKAAGADWSHVARVGVYLARKEDFAAFNRIYAEFAVAPYPARTTIICTLLAGISVEVDCIAVLP